MDSPTDIHRAIMDAFIRNHPGACGMGGDALVARDALARLAVEGTDGMRFAQADRLRKWAKILAEVADGLSPPAAEAPEAKPPICKDCVHHHDVWRGWPTGDVPGCYVEKRIDPVDGNPVYHRCHAMRAEGARCGPAGKLFSPREANVG